MGTSNINTASMQGLPFQWQKFPYICGVENFVTLLYGNVTEWSTESHGCYSKLFQLLQQNLIALQGEDRHSIDFYRHSNEINLQKKIILAKVQSFSTGSENLYSLNIFSGVKCHCFLKNEWNNLYELKLRCSLSHSFMAALA